MSHKLPMFGPFSTPCYIVYKQHRSRMCTIALKEWDLVSLAADLMDEAATIYKLPEGACCAVQHEHDGDGKGILRLVQTRVEREADQAADRRPEPELIQYCLCDDDPMTCRVAGDVDGAATASKPEQ
jgi:hypothetical protein